MAGFWGRQWRRTKNFTAENAGKVGRGAAVAGAGAVATLTCGPICGIAAAAATDGALGGVVERNIRRATDRGARQVEDWLSDPQGPPPEGLKYTTATGTALRFSSVEDAQKYQASDPIHEQRASARRKSIAKTLTIAAAIAAGAVVLARR